MGLCAVPCPCEPYQIFCITGIIVPSICVRSCLKSWACVNGRGAGPRVWVRYKVSTVGYRERGKKKTSLPRSDKDSRECQPLMAAIQYGVPWGASKPTRDGDAKANHDRNVLTRICIADQWAKGAVLCYPRMIYGPNGRLYHANTHCTPPLRQNSHRIFGR